MLFVCFDCDATPIPNRMYKKICNGCECAVRVCMCKLHKFVVEYECKSRQSSSSFKDESVETGDLTIRSSVNTHVSFAI